MKLLLHRPGNVRDLLPIRRYRHVDLIDFDRLQLDPTTYVQRDYRHVETDLVLRGPLLRGRGNIHWRCADSHTDTEAPSAHVFEITRR